MAVFGTVFLEPFAVETHEIAETPGVADKRVLEESGVSRAGDADFGRAFVESLEEHGEQESAGVVVGAIAVVEPRHGENGVLVDTGAVGHAQEMIEPPRRQAGMLAEGCGRARFVVAVDLIVVAGGGEEVGVGGGDLGPNHVASGQVGLFAHGIEPGLVGEQGTDFAGHRGGIAEGDEDTGPLCQQFGGVPVRGRDHRFAGPEAVRERARGDLGLVEVGSDVDIGRADVFAQFLVGHVAVDEADAIFHADAAGHALELQAVAFAFLADEVRVGGAEHDVNESRVIADDVGQGADDIFDAFVRREQAEGEHDRTPGDFKLVLVKARIGEAGVGNAVRDDGDFRVGDAVEAGQHAAGALGHDDQTRGKVD